MRPSPLIATLPLMCSSLSAGSLREFARRRLSKAVRLSGGVARPRRPWERPMGTAARRPEPFQRHLTTTPRWSLGRHHLHWGDITSIGETSPPLGRHHLHPAQVVAWSGQAARTSASTAAWL